MKIGGSLTRIGETVSLISFSDKDFIEVGMEATYGYGDSYPAKVESIERVRGGWEVTLRGYEYRAKDGVKGMGHQEWDILWDKPRGTTVFRVHKDGKLVKNSSDSGRVSLGHASVYYVWEF